MVLQELPTDWKVFFNYLKRLIGNHCFRQFTLDVQKSSLRFFNVLKHCVTFYIVYKDFQSQDFQDCCTVRDHPFSKYVKFSVKVIFVTPDTHMYVYQGWLEILILQKVLSAYEIDNLLSSL